MKKQFQNLRIPATMIASAIVLFTSCKKDDTAGMQASNGHGGPIGVNAIVKSASGDSSSIVTEISGFRLLAGDPLNTTPNVTGGRREINWDGGTPAITNNNNFPFDFFGATDPALPDGRKRGLIYLNTGTGFRIDSTKFAEIDASYATQFEPFSKKKLFSTIGSNVTEIIFKVPGTNTEAFVKGFGAVFTDVDEGNSTSIEYFSGSKSLGVFKVHVRTYDGSFSFLGVNFPDEKVTKVRITAGNGILAAGVKDISNGGTKDLVVMDDFIYDEPKAL